jgi:LPXTG-motif cell wall-anchored protein
MARLGRLFLVTGLVGALVLALAGTALAQTAARATMNATGGSRITGAATLTAQGAQTMVVVRVTGAPANSTHVNHIHVGSCEAEGGIAYPLTDLQTNAQGTATASTMVNATLATVLASRHYVNVHAGASLPSPGVSCGNIVAGASSLPTTGGATSMAYAGFAALAALGVGLMLRRR